MVDKTETEFKALGEIHGGDIRIGAAESDGIKYLARHIKELQTQYPRIRVHYTAVTATTWQRDWSRVC